jgi:hypothetical protein
MIIYPQPEHIEHPPRPHLTPCLLCRRPIPCYCIDREHDDALCPDCRQRPLRVHLHLQVRPLGE